MAIASAVVPLEVMQVGEMAYVDSIWGDCEHVQRLRELGLADGAALEMLQPGTPCIIRLGGQRLCLRSDSRTSILVRTSENA
jgi:Fe2+ transport system protein FeoA